MSKDFKEKYEKVCAIKDKALSLVETQLNGDISSVNAEELGEVMDVAKDGAELMMYCAQAEYYHEVVKAMHEGTPEENSYYLNKYNPEYDGKFYTPMNMARSRDSRGRYMYTNPKMWDEEYDPMYYTEPSGMHYSNSNRNMNMARDIREGRSGMTRMTYMDMKDSGDKVGKAKELEHYMTDLATDLTEMIEGMEPNEKAIVKQRLNALSAKIV